MGSNSLRPSTGQNCARCTAHLSTPVLISHAADSDGASADCFARCRGAPISAVDITYDGHWVLSTSDFYLTVAPTQFKVSTFKGAGFGGLGLASAFQGGRV